MSSAGWLRSASVWRPSSINAKALFQINSLLDIDDFRYVESDYMLVGRRSGRQFRIGDKLTIRVVSANLAKRQLDYEWVITATEALEAPAPPLRKLRPVHKNSGPPRHPAARKTHKKKK